MDKSIEKLLKMNVDLRHYSVDVQKDLRKSENAIINKYGENFKKIVELYDDLTSCDKAITKISSILEHYQTNLRVINQEIIQLQHNTSQIDSSIKNRENLKGKLNQFIEKTIIDPSLINSIMNDPLSEQSFLENLHELSHKIATQKVHVFKGALASVECMEVLNNLKFQAVDRVVEFLHQKIIKLKDPMTNYEMIQNILLKYQFFNEFLIEHHPSAADHICKEYVEIMSKVYSIYFKLYISKISKLSTNMAELTPNDFVNDSSNKSGLNKVFFNKNKVLDRNGYSLDGRHTIWFSPVDKDVIVPNLFVDSSLKFTFEEGFRSLLYSLFDNCCREYFFLNDFFLPNIQRSKELYGQIMSPSFEIYDKFYETSIANNNDIIGTTILLNVAYRLNEISISRGLLIVGDFFEKLYDRLANKFIKLIKALTKFVSQIQPFTNILSNKKPLQITDRFSIFLTSLTLILFNINDNRLEQIIMDFRLEIESLIQLAATHFPNRLDQLIFLIVQYDRIVEVMNQMVNQQIKDIESSKTEQNIQDLVNRVNSYIHDSSVVTSIQSQLNNRIADFIMEHLSMTISNVIDFIKETEIAIKDSKSNDEKVKLIKIDMMNEVIKCFNSSWKSLSESAAIDVSNLLPNIHQKSIIVQKILSTIIELCQKLKVIETIVTGKKSSKSHSNKIISLVDPQQLIVEFRKINI